MKTKDNYYKKNGAIPLIVAHRGASSIAPENTLESFSLAISQAADFVEMDVLKTKDDKLVIFHDSCAGQITDADKYQEFTNKKETRWNEDYNKEIHDCYIDQLTLEEVKKLRIQQKIGPMIAGRSKIFDNLFSIPTFEETIELFIKSNQERIERYGDKAHLAGINLEIKDPDQYRTRDKENDNFLQTVLLALKKYNLHDINQSFSICPIVISSFDQIAVKYFHEHTNLACFQLVDHIFNYPLEDIATYAQGVSCPLSFIIDTQTERSTNYISNAHQLGLQVGIYTIKDDDLEYTSNELAIYQFVYEQLQIDVIVTEFPEKARAIFQAYEIKNKSISFDFLKKIPQANLFNNNFNHYVTETIKVHQ